MEGNGRWGCGLGGVVMRRGRGVGGGWGVLGGEWGGVLGGGGGGGLGWWGGGGGGAFGWRGWRRIRGRWSWRRGGRSRRICSSRVFRGAIGGGGGGFG